MLYKQIICIFLTAVTLISSSRGIVCWLEYNFNHNYIVKKLCIEKDKAKNTCQGRCHLKAKLQENDEEKERHNEKDKLPSLRIKFEENITFIFDKQSFISIRNYLSLGMGIFDNDEISTDKNEPPCPPPRYSYYFLF